MTSLKARAAGVDDYWTKPIDVARLLAGLDRLAAAPRRDTSNSPILAKD